MGRSPKEGYQLAVDLGAHRAENWRRGQRIILAVVDRLAPVTGRLNLTPEHFFLATN